MTTDLVSNLPIPPGEYLEEVLAERGMSKRELALRMGRPAAKLSAIFSGDKAITPDTALQLERATAVPAHIWTGLEIDYRLAQARLREEQRDAEIASETDLVTPLCYSELRKIGMVHACSRGIDKVKALQQYFGVMSLRKVLEMPRYAVAHRHGSTGADDRSPEAVAAWLRVGEVQALQTDCPPFSADRLSNAFPSIRAMTLQQPEDFVGPLLESLAQSGVVMVFCPHFPKTKAQGATFFVTPTKAVVMLSLRYTWADIFWFTLLHELAHILLHGDKGVILEDKSSTKQEREADAFARDTLIEPNDWSKFLAGGTYSIGAIRRFASATGIAPGIVVGRLQHEGIIPTSHCNALRVQYTFAAPT